MSWKYVQYENGKYKTSAGGGGGGTSNYDELVNRPQINGNVLTGNQSGADLGLADTNNVATLIWKGYILNGNFNDLPFGCCAVAGSMTNAPNGSNAGWIVLTFGGVYNSADFIIQIAIGYNPSETYIRRNWGGWLAWNRL